MHGTPLAPDPDEPDKVARAALDLGLRYVVVTSVTRDDLEDGGADHFAETIHAIRRELPGSTRIEVLIPDFLGKESALNKVIEAGPDVLNHNIETTPSIYGSARPQAFYHRSLELIRRAASFRPIIPIKSGIMLGLGETRTEIEQTMEELLDHGCTILTMGQYLQPSRLHLSVKRYLPPEEFDDLKILALNMGFRRVASAPFVRSSFEAEKLFY